ncbi:hypothetical protein RIF29_35427 [Crotalaria pallida]|uniref:RING-type domain-containing protein n=1 Tax=Crotalaria pallida TaxID=3830 RepID=A0AAN9EC62_CROPI
MGCNSREKRSNRRPRPSSSSSSAKPDLDLDDPISKSIAESGLKPLKQPINIDFPPPNPNPSVGVGVVGGGGIDETAWGYCTEEQLEEILMRNMEFIYNDVVSKLVGLGYEEEVAVKAVLKNGHCYGNSLDLLTNILHNSLQFLKSNNAGCNVKEMKTVFSDMKQLQKYSLAGLVCLLQQYRSELTKGDALWCLLMSDLNIAKARGMEIPVPGHVCPAHAPSAVEGGSNLIGSVMPPSQCQFHGGWGFGGSGSGFGSVGGTGSGSGSGGFGSGLEMNYQLQRDIEFPKRFDLTPSLKTLLKRNVAAFAAGYRANSKKFHISPMKGYSGSSSTVSNLDSLSVSGMPNEKSGAVPYLDEQYIMKELVSKLCDLSLGETLNLVAEDKKDEVIINLLQEIKDLEKQVRERKEWAHTKAVQAARKLTGDMTELKTLRMERDEIQKLKKGKQSLDDSTMRRLTEMENALRQASGQVDRANAAVRKLEQENAEIRAEMEASKLSASESVTACKEVAKREKKWLKKLQAWEKQKAKLQMEIADEKVKISQAYVALGQIIQSKNEAEVKWKEELKAKEEAIGLVEQERRSKEADESNNKRKHEALRLKIDIDFQRYKDDVLRLEQELSRLKASARSAELQSNASPESEFGNPQTGSIDRMLQELENLEGFSQKEANGDRECIICKKDEVSVVFLPCAHQVMCARCGDEYGKSGQAACPCCRCVIQQRVTVFGASS